MQLTRKQIHEQVYYYTLILIAISLPLSIFATSMFQIVLVINWVVEGQLGEKWKRAAGNRALQVFLLLYLMHLVGLLWSSDLAYGLKDMRIKLPLLLLPLIVVTSGPLLKQQLHRILLFFSLGVFVASMASVFKLVGWLPGEVQDYRDLSIFMSHIRFSLMIVLALLISVYFLFVLRNSITRFERFLYMGILIWFPIFLGLLKSLSGIVIGGLLGFFLLLRLVFEIRDRVIRFMVLVPVLMIPLFSIIYLGHSVNKFYNFEELNVTELDSLTILGNPYVHVPEKTAVENGHYTWVYVCEKELEEEWNQVSALDYGGRTSNGNSLRVTLIRYLSSRGLRKDAAGFSQLTEHEIRAIERGTANYIYLERFKLYPRIYEVIWEIDSYKSGKNPNEKSLVQRYLYLDAGWKIAKKHLLFGVGNGDVRTTFKEHYESINSPLKEKWRRRAHNQFLTFLISFGIPGLLICIAALLAPLFLAGKKRSFLATGFLILILLSMLNEDTLETACGAVFVAFFYALFMFGPDFPWLRDKTTRKNG
jgi:O-Antigen ligase